MAKKKEAVDDLKVEGLSEDGTRVLPGPEGERPESMHEAEMNRIAAEKYARDYASQPKSDIEKNPTTYGDYHEKGDSPEVGDDVFYILQDGPMKGQFRPAKVVRTKGDVCELFVFFSAEDEFSTEHVQEVSRTAEGSAEHATWSFEFPK